MKRNLLGVCAIALAVAFSAFTAKKTTSFYFEYKVAQAGAQNQTSSYNNPITTSPGNKSGADVLAWMKVEAQSSTAPTADEFIATFNSLNVTNSGSNSLNDESEDHISLELQAD